LTRKAGECREDALMSAVLEESDIAEKVLAGERITQDDARKHLFRDITFF